MKKNKGFSLMELTIVLAILAIIAAILIPTFFNLTDGARLRSDVQSARTIQNAMELYRLNSGRQVAGGNDIAQILTNLTTAEYLSARGTDIQTAGANWVVDEGRVFVDITGLDGGVQRAYNALSDADRAMVRGGVRTP
ncbi:MAG: type II secretion system GspH family protein [Defluviitaleaceae bacterium]|nr:type II secretion system GspH family protein [Defluviitaleaceae bacterium]